MSWISILKSELSDVVSILQLKDWWSEWLRNLSSVVSKQYSWTKEVEL